MHAVFAGLTTRDEIHLLDHVPDPRTKATSVAHLSAAGGPATNAAVAFAALSRASRGIDEGAPASVSLLTALGASPVAGALSGELTGLGVDVMDAAQRSGGAGSEPALSSIIEHPAGRMVASTNRSVPTDPALARQELVRDREAHGLPDVVLVDGHHPELADLALRLGTRGAPGTDPDPFAELEDRPSHLRLLDGGSWKPAFVPLLGLIDVAVVSADFHPPLPGDAPGAVADFLRGFGIARIVRTDGANPVRWWWDGASGQTPVPAVDDRPAVSTMGAGDVFHGALAWALARAHAAGGEAPADPDALLAFAGSVAALSTRSFGTRAWTAEGALVDLAAS
jgi:sugar/nucleoside kinase (ribokinase family)